MLLGGIVILLSVAVAALAFGLSEPAEPAPTATLEMTAGDCEYERRHTAGDPIDGDRAELVGVENPDALTGRTLTAGDSVQLEPTADQVELVYESSDLNREAVLERFDIDTDAIGGGGCQATLYTATGGYTDGTAGDGSPVTTLSATADASALGPPDVDLTGDVADDTPFVEGGDAIVFTNATNGTTTLADDCDIPGAIEGSKTRLAVGSWDGSPESVFFVNETHDTLYRVTSSESPVAVATPGNGVQAISGIGDIDGDGDDEIVYVGRVNGKVKYVENVSGSNDVAYLHDDGDDRIDGSAGTGLV